MDKLELIVKTLDKKKASDIECIRVEEVTTLADYFVIATGTSTVHVRSLSDEIEFVMSGAGYVPISVTGKSSGWILLDYGDIMIDIFTADLREQYALDKLWADGQTVDLSNILSEG